MSTTEKATTEPPKARVIPGLPTAAAIQAGKKRRSGKKVSTTPALALATDSLVLPGPSDTIVEAPVGVSEAVVAPSNGAGLRLDSLPVVNEEEAEEEKRLSPVAVIQKRIKAHSKKLQRIATYENETEKLNPDQQRAVASKPGIELAIKELQELVTVFTGEEAEETKRLDRKTAAQERRIQAQIAAAIQERDASEESHLALLLQFLHLRSLFNSESTGFAPPLLPPVVQNATPQEYAAVMSLFEALANGPLMGGGEDAIERVKRLSGGDEVEIVQGISYGRIKRMIADLTAPPAELDGAVSLDDTNPPTQANDIAFGTASELTNGHATTENNYETAAPAPGGFAISFMQASDIVPTSSNAGDTFSKAEPAVPSQAASTSWADDDGEVFDPPASFSEAIVVPDAGPQVGELQPLAVSAAAAAAAAAEPVVEQGGGAATEVPTSAAPPAIEDDGFQAAKRKRGGHTGGGSGDAPRGRGGRGGGGGRGGRGGPPREGGGDRPPRTEGQRGERSERSGAGGERGASRGRGDGRGRGGRGGRGRGGAPGGAPAPAA